VEEAATTEQWRTSSKNLNATTTIIVSEFLIETVDNGVFEVFCWQRV